MELHSILLAWPTNIRLGNRVTRLGNLLPIGLLLEDHYDEVAQRNGDILGYFLFKQTYYILTETSCFKIWYFKVSKVV